MSVNILEIINDYLKANGYEGLVNTTNECGCGVDDLAPCGDITSDCEGAHAIKQPVGAEFDVVYYEGKRADCHDCKKGGHDEEQEA